jgi:hypothetical protein
MNHARHQKKSVCWVLLGEEFHWLSIIVFHHKAGYMRHAIYGSILQSSTKASKHRDLDICLRPAILAEMGLLQ